MHRPVRRADWLLAAAVFVASLAVYVRTLAPSVAEMFDDSLEFQLIASRMAIAHPTGYPLFSILLKLFTFLPFGDAAFRVNLMTALFAASAAAILYLAARQIVNSRAAAFCAALVFAFGPTFWSQANLVEVYSFQALLTASLLGLALAWGRGQSRAASPASGPRVVRILGRPFTLSNFPSLAVLAFFAGIMLTHHRMSVLLFPALAVYVLTYDRSVLKPRVLLATAAAFLLPLLLYLYLPLRGLATSSLDGTYQNTLSGFLGWVTGASYGVFITGNPFKEERQGIYYLNLFLAQFTWVGLTGAAAGFVALFRRAWREWLFLALALTANLGFALSYRVVDIDVFFIPSFLISALFLAAGLDLFARWNLHDLLRGPAALARAFDRLPARVARAAAAAPVVALAFLLLPAWLVASNWTQLDLAGKWDVLDYGRDLLAQPLPGNATVIGLGGEVSLIQFVQDNYGLRRDVATVRADTEPERLDAIARALQSGRSVLITRPLAGAPKLYSLASFGPLVQVQPQPNTTAAPSPSHRMDAPFGGVRLLGYDLDLSRLEGGENWHPSNGRQLRVTLYWLARQKIGNSRLVSVKLIDANGRVAAQLDRRPVLDAYPTNAFRQGEYISDTYTVPVFAGAAGGDYGLQVTLYDPDSGQVYGQQELARVNLKPDTREYSPQLLGVTHVQPRAIAGLTLVGYSLDTTEPFADGDAVPVTLLWRAYDDRPHALELRLTEADGRLAAAQPIVVQATGVPSGGEYTRWDGALPVHASLSGAPLTVELGMAPRGVVPCGLPFFSACIRLGQIAVGPAEK